MNRFFIVLGIPLLAGCVSTGTNFDASRVDQFQIGKTTCSEAVAAMGKPQSDTRSARGERTVMYAYSDVRSRPENFVPYLNLVVGGADTDSKSLTLICDSRGILKDYTVSTGSTDVDQNLSR